MIWQLVVHEDPEMASVAAAQVRRVLKNLDPAAGNPDIRSAPIQAHNIQQAGEYLEEQGAARCSVVIVGSATPQSAQASAALTGRTPTRQFVKDLKKAHPGLPVIVIATTPDQSLLDFIDGLDMVALVAIDSAFSQKLGERLVEYHGAGPTGRLFGAASAPVKAVPGLKSQVELHLYLGRQPTWHIKRLGDDPFEDAGNLTIDDGQLERVLFESDDIERAMSSPRDDSGRWLAKLKFLSDDLRGMLFEGDLPNVGCWETFVKHRERVGGIEHARIRVTVDDRTHPMLVEALRDRAGQDHEYWALRAPLFRRYNRPAARRPLFKDPDKRQLPINVLVIEADGRAGNLPDYGGAVCNALPHCAVEASGIVALLTRAGLQPVASAPSASAPGSFEHLALGAVEGDLRDAVAAKLRERPWHVVHFCGHVVGSTLGDAGLVLVPERGGVMSIAALTAQLHAVQLMFLSSCRSSAARVVMQAVEQHIPAVLGFQWVIDDEAAARFALAFYEALLMPGGAGHKYLEYAFMHARRAVYENAPREPTWVAPVLVMQMD